MTERELLEFAAKAAGHEYRFNNSTHMGPHFIRCATGYQEWSPHTDDGDAFRLADTLEMSVRFGKFGGIENPVTVEFDWQITDRLAETRLSIVRAAAKIGKAMP